jgi:hypothetical protein
LRLAGRHGLLGEHRARIAMPLRQSTRAPDLLAGRVNGAPSRMIEPPTGADDLIDWLGIGLPLKRDVPVAFPGCLPRRGRPVASSAITFPYSARTPVELARRLVPVCGVSTAPRRSALLVPQGSVSCAARFSPKVIFFWCVRAGAPPSCSSADFRYRHGRSGGYKKRLVHLIISTQCRLDLRLAFRSAASVARIHRR